MLNVFNGGTWIGLDTLSQTFYFNKVFVTRTSAKIHRRSCNFRWCSSHGWYAWHSRRPGVFGAEPGEPWHRLRHWLQVLMGFATETRARRFLEARRKPLKLVGKEKAQKWETQGKFIGNGEQNGGTPMELRCLQVGLNSKRPRDADADWFMLFYICELSHHSVTMWNIKAKHISAGGQKAMGIGSTFLLAQVNDAFHLLKFEIPAGYTAGINPGQHVKVYVPNISKDQPTWNTHMNLEEREIMGSKLRHFFGVLDVSQMLVIPPPMRLALLTQFV